MNGCFIQAEIGVWISANIFMLNQKNGELIIYGMLKAKLEYVS